MSYCRLSLQHCRLECDLAGNVGIFRALPGVAVSVAVGGVTRAAINHRRAIELLYSARDGEETESVRQARGLGRAPVRVLRRARDHRVP